MKTSESNKDFMLTTYDNPFNPFTDFETWWKTDILLGHDCCGLLAQTAFTSEVYSDEINEKETIRAMDEICKDFPLIYRKVSKEDYSKVI